MYVEYLHALCSFQVMRVRQERNEERRKERKEKINKSIFKCMVFSTLRKLSGTYGVELVMQYQGNVVCKLIAFLCCISWSCLPSMYTVCTGILAQPYLHTQGFASLVLSPFVLRSRAPRTIRG